MMFKSLMLGHIWLVSERSFGANCFHAISALKLA